MILVAIAILTFVSNAEARQRHRAPVVRCVESGTVMFPTCGMGFAPSNNFLAGIREIKVTLHREKRGRAVRVRQARQVASYGAPSPSIGYTIGRPMRYIGGRLICAVNVGAALAERGIKGTGSALALSYLHWGHSAGGPVPGAVIVSARRGGGHVAIVSRVENGVVFAWNATGGQSGWREIPYRHHVLDYRVPG